MQSMGTFGISVEVAAITNGQSTAVEALVDTGATHSVFPGALLERLGVRPSASMRFTLADERRVEYPVGQAAVKIGERRWIASVVFGPNDATPIVGSTTLETFGLAVDPVGKRLIPVDGLLKPEFSVTELTPASARWKFEDHEESDEQQTWAHSLSTLK